MDRRILAFIFEQTKSRSDNSVDTLCFQHSLPAVGIWHLFLKKNLFLLFKISSFEDGHQQHWRHEVGPRPPWKDCQPYPTGNSCFGGVATTFHRQIVGNHKNGCICMYVCMFLILLLHQNNANSKLIQPWDRATLWRPKVWCCCSGNLVRGSDPIWPLPWGSVPDGLHNGSLLHN